MKRFISILILIIQIQFGFSQTIDELEEDISWYSSSQFEKIDSARTLHRIDPLNEKAIEYLCRYYFENNIDSVSILLNGLIRRFPEKKEPYLLKAELLYYEKLNLTKSDFLKRRIKYLKSALEKEPNDAMIINLIADDYYIDFIRPLASKEIFDFESPFEDEDSLSSKKIKLKSLLNFSADSSLVYFYKQWKVDERNRKIIYFPIKQLECFLNNSDSSPLSPNTLESFETCYFPPWYFADLSDDWECDTSMDLLYEIDSSNDSAKWIENQLKDLGEECIYNLNLNKNEEVVRFTYLRSFGNPISVRIQKKGNRKFLFWKVGKGAGSYPQEGLKLSGERRLTENEWIEFLRLLNKADFDNLVNNHYVLMTDGAELILEKKSQGKYKAHKTNWPNIDFKNCCFYLLKLAGIDLN